MQSVILGTAQWGLDYGVTNAAGRLSDEAVREIADTAWGLGLRTLDTAPAYGDAEERIPSLGHGFALQTKVSIGSGSPGSVASSVRSSLSRVDASGLAAVLVHDWSTADDVHRREAASVLEGLRDEGLVASVGVSGYGEEDIDTALSSFVRLDVVQVPVSVLDQRLVGSTGIAEARSRGGRVQARSVFLQGAALASPDHPELGRHPDIARLRSVGHPLDLCLSYVASLDWVDEVVVAATSAAELGEIVAALHHPVSRADWSALASADPWLVDPRRWTAPTERS